MTVKSTRWISSLAASAILMSGMTFASISPAHADESCNATKNITIMAFNDFHGRIAVADRYFSLIEQARQTHGEDKVLTISSGDDIGGTPFESMINQDNPTLDILNAIELDVQTVGNHEFDKGWSDLSGRVADRVKFPMLGANVYKKGTTEVAPPLKPYEAFTVNGLRIAVVGVVTGSLPSLVDSAGLAGIDIGRPVEALNREAKKLKESGKYDLIIASLHEGAADGSGTPENNAASSEPFNDIYANLSNDFSLVLNGHTHQKYNWKTKNGIPLMQAGSYGKTMNSITVGYTDAGQVCSVAGELVDAPEKALDTPRIQKIQEIVKDANAKADVKGAEVVGKTTAAISTPDGAANVRDVESPMTNMVAQMFKDTLGAKDPNFIGVQNPGGTRSSFDQGDVTYKEAAMALPFANSLYITELTGAQVKKMLEQQWQREASGKVPSRPFLRLGLSKNVSYTYDETRPEGQRITGVYVNGAPIDPTKSYKLASGSFLIGGGDNFHVFKEGKNTRDAGRVDLEAWTEWVGKHSPLKPDYSKRGISVSASVTGNGVTLTLGKPKAGGAARETLDMALDTSKKPVSAPLANKQVKAYVGKTLVGTGSVTKGVGTVTIDRKNPAVRKGAVITLAIADSGTTAHVVVPAEWAGSKSGKPGLPKTGN